MKYLLAEGASVLIRGKTIAPGDVAEIPDNLYAAIDAAVKARFSASVADADVDLTAYEIASSDDAVSTPSDPVEANAVVLDISDWEDVEDVDASAGQAFNEMVQAGAALMFQPVAGTHYSGARWANVIPDGNFLIAFDFSISRTEDSSADPGIFGIVGFSPSGLEDATPDWYGGGIDGKTSTVASVAPRAYYREDAALWAEIGFSAATAPGGYGYRFAIRRVGTTVTFWWVQPHQNNLIQLGKRTDPNIAGEADLFVRTQGDGGAGLSRYLTLTRVALTGLDIVGNRLVAAA